MEIVVYCPCLTSLRALEWFAVGKDQLFPLMVLHSLLQRRRVAQPWLMEFGQ